MIVNMKKEGEMHDRLFVFHTFFFPKTCVGNFLFQEMAKQTSNAFKKIELSLRDRYHLLQKQTQVNTRKYRGVNAVPICS